MSDAPGGLSDAEFKAWYVEAGSWIWGTTQGAFNEKATVSQIIVDAVIGMFPLVGDVTAARDILAISIGLSTDPKKREDTLEWVSLVIMLLALIPVLGGVIKGVGRLVVRGVKAARLLKDGGAIIRTLGSTAEEIIQLMHRMGIGNAQRWFLDLNILKYQARVLQEFKKTMHQIIYAFERIIWRLRWVLPNNLIERMKGLIKGFKEVTEKGNEMIPKAVKEFHGMLVDMQEFVRSGGSRLAVAADNASGAGARAGATGARVANHSNTVAQTSETVTTGTHNVSRKKEARLREDRSSNPPKPKVGRYPQNKAIKDKPKTYEDVYTKPPPKDGFPDLTDYVRERSRSGKKEKYFPDIEAFSGRIMNRALRSDEKIYRVFGPGGDTFGVTIKDTYPGGGWWGVGEPPRSAKEWRETCAVLDEFNHDTFIVVGTPPKSNDNIKGAFGTVAEQRSVDIPGQYLPGGAQQARINFSDEKTKQAFADAQKKFNGKDPYKFTDPVTGIEFEMRPTGWPDANGIHGYASGSHSVNASTVPLSKKDIAPQTNPEVYIK